MSKDHQLGMLHIQIVWLTLDGSGFRKISFDDQMGRFKISFNTRLDLHYSCGGSSFKFMIVDSNGEVFVIGRDQFNGILIISALAIFHTFFKKFHGVDHIVKGCDGVCVAIQEMVLKDEVHEVDRLILIL